MRKKKYALKLLYFKWHWKISRLHSYRTPFINRFVIYLTIANELHYSSQLNFIRDTAHATYMQVKKISLLFNHETQDYLFKIGGFASSSAPLGLSDLSLKETYVKIQKIFSKPVDNFQ